MSKLPEIRAMQRTGNSANIVWYAPKTKPAADQPYVYAEVLCEAAHRINGKWVAKASPDFRVTVRVAGWAGDVGRFAYTPKITPKNNELDADTVTGLIRAWAVREGHAS